MLLIRNCGITMTSRPMTPIQLGIARTISQGRAAYCSEVRDELWRATVEWYIKGVNTV